MATLIAFEDVSPAADAELLRKACHGWGTDEKSVISILGHRNAIQRKLIREAYQELYQEDLVKRLEHELSGDFERAVYRWNLEPADRDAVLANVALRKENRDHRVIIELACTLSPEELFSVKRAYQCRYKRSLEEDIASHTSSDLRKLLVGLVSIHRYQGDEVNLKLANSESSILRNAIEEKTFNHEEILRIVTTRSKPQLMATLNRYKDEHGCTITKHLKDDSADEYTTTLRTTIRCMSDPIKYFEKVIRNAIKRNGTNEDALTRVIVTHAEKDLKEIMEQYYKRNSVPLDQAVAKETSGHYKRFLLALLGKEN
ncbi:annexin-like protein RJ4 [Cynara cardunculus var. scolymus]|uniref:annexin-like protein RJ4 n=1 Tax=Cynara cardunculus var. scolymus TaxID=59895 RepID=UPI000D62CA50|nr:annexin-like protein RJ4 [Cynara cardunculus var. scolymus]